MKYTIIVPVYNRLDEVKELLGSAENIDFPRNEFEILFVDDGSKDGLKEYLENYESESKLQIRAIYQANQGPGKARNNGMKEAYGEMFIFIDSDCLLPSEYFISIDEYLNKYPLDTFGGCDAAHDSFSDLQKGINYAMTSFITTGGIRGKKKHLTKFEPRSFNMGISKQVFKSVGGFGNIHPGEDPDLSLRIKKKGFSIGLIPDCYVYHKRRIDFRKFALQVYKFGVVRNILFKWHPETFSLLFFLPSLFLLGSILGLFLSVLFPLLFSILFILFNITIFVDGLLKTKSFKISIIGVFASYIQLYGYGWGFIKSFWNIKMLKKDEQKVFSKFFF